MSEIIGRSTNDVGAVNVYCVMGFRPNYFTCTAHLYLYSMLEILEDCIVFLNEKIYISALYRRHKCVVQVKCSTSISVLYK